LALDYGRLSDEELLTLGAAVETRLADIQALARSLEADYLRRRQSLLKPGIKVALGLPTALAGIALTPITLGWSLLLTVVGTGVAISDGVDFARDAADMLRLRRTVIEATMQAKRDTEALREVTRELERRATPSY
jgi:hypothetical protein